VEEEDKKVR